MKKDTSDLFEEEIKKEFTRKIDELDRDIQKFNSKPPSWFKPKHTYGYDFLLIPNFS